MVRKALAQARRTREVSLKQNGWWLGQLYSASIYDWPFAVIPAGAGRIESMTATTIRDAARRYLNTDRYGPAGAAAPLPFGASALQGPAHPDVRPTPTASNSTREIQAKQVAQQRNPDAGAPQRASTRQR